LDTPIVHAFENTPPNYPTKIAVIIIEGDSKQPSEYS